MAMTVTNVEGVVRKMSLRARDSLHKIEKSIASHHLSGFGQDHHQSIDTITHLTHTKQRYLKKQDFATEVRATRDISNFVDESSVLLDLPETELISIVDKLLDVMLPEDLQNGSTPSRQDLHKLIFVDKDVESDLNKNDNFEQNDNNHIILAESIQGWCRSHNDSMPIWEQTWLCGLVTIPAGLQRSVGIARLKHPSNLGPHAEEVRFFIFVLCPSDIKGTKTAEETGRTFATLFSDICLRLELYKAETSHEFLEILRKKSKALSDQNMIPNALIENGEVTNNNWQKNDQGFKWYHIGKGILNDISGRLPYYTDDWVSGWTGKNTVTKVISTIFFLYFSVILPAVALGVLNDYNTNGNISIHQVVLGQVIGALVFSLISGQPLVVVMTTAPLALFIKIIYTISIDIEVDFLSFYAMVGLWNSFFLIVFSLMNLSILMKYSSRSTEEIFSNFISIALTVDAIKHVALSFKKHYWAPYCFNNDNAVVNPDHHPLVLSNVTSSNSLIENHICSPEISFLSLILMLGTVWLGVTLYNFTKTPFLSAAKREALSDYALPVSVIVFSVIGTVLFSEVNVKKFSYPKNLPYIHIVAFQNLSLSNVFMALPLGFSLSLLFFMDQNISAAMVNAPDNKLKKGNAYHWDLLIVSIINGFLCVFGLPFMHAVLPHSPLHVKCLADTEQQVDAGCVKDIVIHVRETRITTFVANFFIGISMFFLGYVLDYIPAPVLDGLFLYMAITALDGNEMFERISLLFMEQSAYPPNHYIRRVPQRKIHLFTLCQMLQLAVLCTFGFMPWPYLKMVFPVLILIFLPIRHILMPKLIEAKFLDVIDSIHT